MRPHRSLPPLAALTTALTTALVLAGTLSACTDKGDDTGDGSGGGHLGSSLVPAEHLDATTAAPLGTTAVNPSGVLVDDEGRTYVLLASDGEETDLDDEDARPHQGGEYDTAPDLAQVARLTPTGALDDTWGDAGTLSVPFSFDVFVSFHAQAMAFDGAGGIVVAGQADFDPALDSPPRDAGGNEVLPILGMVRVSTDGAGSVDASYGTEGSAPITLGTFSDVETEDLDVVGLLADADGATVAIKRRKYAVSTTILRVDAHGAPDSSTWDQSEIAEASKDLPNSFEVTGLATNAAGDTYWSYPDATFELPAVGQPADLDAIKAAAVDIPYQVADREQAIRSANGVRAFAVLDDGSVVSANVLYNDEAVRTSAFVTKMGADDTPADGFGTGGYDDLADPPDGSKDDVPTDAGVTWLSQDDMAFATALTVAGDGSIYVAGAGDDGETALRVMKLTADGAIDTSWGDDGVLSAPFSIASCCMYDQPHPLGIQQLADGSLLVPVEQDSGPYFGRGVFRITADGVLDTRWGKDGMALVEPTVPAE